MPQRDPSTGRFLASGAAILTADADPFSRGLQQASGELDAWGKSLGKQLSGIGGSLRSKFGTMFSVGLGAGIGTSIAGAIQQIPHMAGDALADLSKQGGMAKALGLSAEQFTGIAGVAKSVGEDTREFVESLVTMGKLGHDAFHGIGEVAGPAFAALNINAADFVKMRVDEQFFTMFEALSKVGDGLTRTRLIMNAFGEDGGKWLLPLLGKSPEELRKMADGFAVSSESMKKATAASEAWKKTQQATSMVIREAAVVAAPALIDAAGRIAKAIGDSKESLEIMANLGGDMLRDFIVPGATHATDLASNFVKVAKAVSDVNKELERNNGLNKEGSKEGGFWSKFPQSGKEWGQSLGVMISMQRDAWRDVRRQIFDWDRERYNFYASLMGWTKQPRPHINPYQATEDALDQANRPPPPPEKVYGGLFNSLAAMKKANDAVIDKAKKHWQQLVWNLPFISPHASGANTFTSAFGDTDLYKQLGGMGSLLSSFGLGLGGLASLWQRDPRKGAGSWAGHDEYGALKPRSQFIGGGAFEQGGREAYSLEVASRGQQIARQQTDLAKQQLDEVKQVKNELKDIKNAVVQVAGLWEVR